MSEYNDNNYNSNEQMYHYSNTPNYTNPTPAPANNGKHKGSGKAGRAVRKIGAITLSAVLFGGVASGTFLGLNYLAGYTPGSDAAVSAEVSDGSAAENTSSDNSTGLMKTTSIADNNAIIKGSLDVTDISKSVMPSIVSITNKSVQEVQSYLSMFGFSGPTQLQETESAGSGIVIGKNDSELLIVTNYHVVQGADTLSATFIDNQTFEAQLKGSDPDNDLAVIAIPLSSIPEDTMNAIAFASIGDSDTLEVGEQVVAIGNALGYGQSVTTGIVSATDRALQSSRQMAYDENEEIPTYIQTDAAINPGNSGGALVNMKGELVGINSAKLASTEIEGMGYAIPISRVSDIIETLMNEKTRVKVAENEKSSIGISGLTVDKSVSQAYGIPAGVYIAEVTKDGAAEAAGLKKGEVITKFDGKSISDIGALKELLTYYSVGETVDITVKIPGSNGYTESTFQITLGKAPAAESSDSNANENAAGGENGIEIPAFPGFGNSFRR